MKKFICVTFILTTLMTLIFTFNVQAAVEKPISFLQGDSEWGSKPYSVTGSRSQTIASSGCGPTSMAMVLNYYIDNTITPVEAVNYALKNNHRTRSNGTSWAYFKDMANQYDLEFLQTASSVEALEWMNTQEDPLIICSMGPGLWTKGGHFILLWDVENGVAHINDPASTNKSRTENSYSYMASQCKQYFCFNKETLPEPEPELEIKTFQKSISVTKLMATEFNNAEVFKNSIQLSNNDNGTEKLIEFSKLIL